MIAQTSTELQRHDTRRNNDHNDSNTGSLSVSPDSGSSVRRPCDDQAQHRLPARVDDTRSRGRTGASAGSTDISVADTVIIAADPRPRFR